MHGNRRYHLRGWSMSSGCYRCGLSDGSAERLCETCYRMRFKSGRDTNELPVDSIDNGLEFSPRLRLLFLSSSAALYVGLIGFCIAAQTTHTARSTGDPNLEFFHNAEQQPIVQVNHRIPIITTIEN